MASYGVIQPLHYHDHCPRAGSQVHGQTASFLLSAHAAVSVLAWRISTSADPWTATTSAAKAGSAESAESADNAGIGATKVRWARWARQALPARAAMGVALWAT